jgi:hypothetical protein
MRRTASAGKSSKSRGSSTKRRASRASVTVAVCLKPEGAGDLVLRKLYRILPDKVAAKEGYLRVVDESGEDYLYPASHFAVVRVSAAVAKSLRLVA